MDEDAFELIKHFLILDYIYSAQFSLKAASKNYNSHFGEFLDCDTMERKKIENMIKNIFNEYPKWIKRGNI